MSRLSLENVVVAYGAEAVLRSVSLEVPHGALVAVVGPSGCGKTTLLRTVAGLVNASSGEIRLGERMVATHGLHLAPEKRRVGWVPQDAALFPHLSVAENVAFGLGPARRSGRPSFFGRQSARDAANTERVARLLELVSLAALADRAPAALSGGQAQRVALARALAASPDIVLLDEPFGALDPLLRSELRAEVRELLRVEGMTGLLVTHDQGEALSVADFVAVMNAGEIVQFGRPEEIYRRPATPWVAGFVGDAVLLDGHWHTDAVSCALGRIPAQWGGAAIAAVSSGTAVTVMVRPEEVELCAPDAAALQAVISAVNYTGHDAMLELRLDDGTRVASRVAASGVLSAGRRVGVRVRGRVLAYGIDSSGS